MTDPSSPFKEKGNAAFKGGYYTEAAKQYTQALDACQSNSARVVLLNNRAAAYLKDGQPSSALKDARESLGLEETFKGHFRAGAACSANGDFEDAVTEYKKALAMQPNDAEVSAQLAAALQQVGRGNEAPPSSATHQQPSGASAVNPKLAVYLDLAVPIVACLHLVSMLLAPAWAARLWTFAMMAFQYRQFTILSSTITFSLSMATLKQLAASFSGQWALLCLLLIMTGAPPQILLLMAACIYCVCDLVFNYYGVLSQTPLVGSSSALWAKLQPQLDKAKQNRDYLFINAAMCEIMTLVMSPLMGAPFLVIIAMTQFLKMRYRHDGYSRQAFWATKEMFGKLFYHRLCPPFIGNLYTKFCHLVFKFGTG